MTDDTRAIQAAISAAPATGAIIYFPAGVYISNNFHVINRNGLTFQGDGLTSVIKRPPLPGNTRIATIENCADLIVRDIAFDENGITNFGGVNLRGVRRVRIENTRHFDSRPWSVADPNSDGDHYSWNFGIFWLDEGTWTQGIVNEDVVIVNNLIEDLTFEMNYLRRVLVEGNTIRRPYFGFGTFSNRYNAESGTPGGLTEDLVVRSNTIVDPLGFGIAVHLDPGSDNNSIFRRILIAGNRIRMSRTARPAVSIGATTTSQTRGNVFEDIEIRDNDTDARSAAGEIGFYSFTSYNFFFRRVTLLNNRLAANGRGHGIGMRRAQDCVIAGNVLRGLGGTGLEMHDHLRNNRIERNTVETTGLAYWFGASLGGNRFVRNRYLGKPVTALQSEEVHRSDLVEQPVQLRSSHRPKSSRLPPGNLAAAQSNSVSGNDQNDLSIGKSRRPR